MSGRKLQHPVRQRAVGLAERLDHRAGARLPAARASHQVLGHPAPSELVKAASEALRGQGPHHAPDRLGVMIDRADGFCGAPPWR